VVQAAIDKAKVLIEALPYMQRFVGKTIVIKYGGAAMKDVALRASFAVDVVLLKQIGVRPVIVHGGGPQIGALLERLGRESTFVDGLRVTDDDTMEVVEMVLAGPVNREIVELIQRGGGRAVGLTGSDGGLIRVQRRLANGRDIGRVGEVVAVDPAVIEAVIEKGFLPVVAPIGVGDDGLTYNVNADEAAGAIAQALRAEKLMLLTDVEGVLDADGKLIRQLDRQRAREQMADGTIRGGMIPKVECCLAAVQGGVARAHVVDGRLEHAVLLEIFTDRGVGTLLTR
jgi:acetylglutamate kinase